MRPNLSQKIASPALKCAKPAPHRNEINIGGSMRFSTYAALFMCGSSLLAASSSALAEDETELDMITVTVNKIRQALDEVVGGVSVGTREEAQTLQQETVREILAPMPGVSTEQNADDPAVAINLRGLQDFGRVAVTIDGARQNFQRSGHNANGMFYFEPEMMQQVTVVRGPIANIYGSGAIGGVVSFETIDALSFLRANEDSAIQEKVQYNTNSEGILSSTIGAQRFGEFGGVIGNLVYRSSREYSDGNGDVVPNSGQDIVAGLVKGTLTPADGHRLDVSYINNNDNFENGLTTIYDNEVSAQTLAAKYNWDGGGNPLYDLTVDAYWTATEQNQDRKSGRLVGTSQNFRIDTYGGDFYNNSQFQTGSLTHVVTVGADVFQDQVKVEDPAGTADLFTPSGQRTVGGAFIQDQIAVTRWLDVLVAGRWDAYELQGGGNESSGSHFSPKGTIVLKPFQDPVWDGVSFYGIVAQGYRAPAITETLVDGIHPPPAIFTFIPNPDLKPETATTIEGGVTAGFENLFQSNDVLNVRLGVFNNDVKNYIGGVYNPFLATYKYENISEARLWGIEGEINYDAGWMFAGLAGSAIRGDNLTSDQPLETVPPDKLVSTLGFRLLDDRATLGARWFAVASQDRVPPGAPTSEAFNLVNLFSSFAFNEDLSAGFNVDNLFDEQYTVYLDSLPSPGRTILFTFTGRLGG